MSQGIQINAVRCFWTMSPIGIYKGASSKLQASTIPQKWLRMARELKAFTTPPPVSKSIGCFDVPKNFAHSLRAIPSSFHDRSTKTGLSAPESLMHSSDPFGSVGLRFMVTLVVGLVLPMPAFVGSSRVSLELSLRDDELRGSSATSEGVGEPPGAQFAGA